MRSPSAARAAEILFTRRQMLRAMGAAGLGAAATIGAGCQVIKGTDPLPSGSLAKPPAPDRKRVIEIYNIWGAPTGSGWVQLAQRYERTHPDVGVRVTFAPTSATGAGQPKLFAAIAANDPPDLAQIVPFQTPQFAALGVMTDLTPYFKRSGLSGDDFFAPAWNDMNWKDRIWQMQWDADPNFPFFWNKDLFEASGLDPDRPPRTIDEVDAASQKIIKRSGANVVKIGMIPWDTYGPSNSAVTWGWAFGASFYDQDRGEVTPDNDLAVKALEWMAGYAASVGGASRVAVSPPTITLAPFGTGNVGMAGLVAPNWADVRKAKPNMHVGATLLPFQPPGASKPGDAAWFGGWSMFIPKGAKNPDDAWEFLKWVCTDDGGTAAQWETIGFPPAYKRSPTIQRMKNDPVMAPFYPTLVNAQHARPSMEVSDFYAAQLDVYVQKAVFGEIKPLQAMQTVKELTMNELERFQRELAV